MVLLQAARARVAVDKISPTLRLIKLGFFIGINLLRDLLIQLTIAENKEKVNVLR